MKTAKLSPRLPLLIGRQTDEKPKQTCELTFFPDVFLSQQEAGSREGNRSEVTSTRVGSGLGRAGGGGGGGVPDRGAA